MAPLAGDRRKRIRARWTQLIAPAPGRAEFALHLALICALTILVAEIYQTPDAALAAYVGFFVNKPDRVGSVLTSLIMTVLVSIIVALLMGIAALTLDQPPLRVAIMAALSLLLLFLASASKLKPLASTITLILAYAIDVLGRVPAGELATRGLLYAWLCVGIPAGVTIVVNLVIGPSPRRLVERGIATRLRMAAKIMACVGPSEDAARMRRQGLDIDVHGLVRFALLERAAPRADLLAIQQAARSSETLLMIAFELYKDASAPAEWRSTAAGTLEQMADIFDRGRYPVDIDPPAGPALAMDTAAGLLMSDFADVLTAFATPASPPASPVAGPERANFFLADALSNPTHIRYAIKVTLAAMFCYLFYSLSDWPGIHTCLITCYIVALDTTAETIEKLSLRIAGASVGAVMGIGAIIWLTPNVDHIGGLLALVFAGGLAGAWIAAGSPRIGYAGFQLAFAFFLCVIQGTGPEFDLTVARDRIIGIMIGNAVVYFVFTWIWPVSIADRIDPAIAQVLRSLANIARLPARADRRDRLPAIQTVLAPIERDLEIAHYEPASMQRTEAWFERRSQLIALVENSEAQMLLSDNGAWLNAEASRLDAVASELDSGSEEGGTPQTTDQMESFLAH